MKRKTQISWLPVIAKTMKPKYVQELAEAMKASAFESDAEKISKLVARCTSPDERRTLSAAIMYVSANCPYNVVKQAYNKQTDKNEQINETHYLTYSQTLQALLTNKPEYFRGNLIDAQSAVECSMKHKWELFRQGFFVYRDALRRAPFHNRDYELSQDELQYSNLYRSNCERAHAQLLRERSEKLQVVVA